MSKGSKQRPTNKLQFDKNYNSINWNNEPKLTKEQIKTLKKEVRKAFKTNENNN